jgi:hypothetical protein
MNNVELKYFLRKTENGLGLDSCLDSEIAEIEATLSFVRWLTEDDIANLEIIPPDLDELARKSDEYWRKRYNVVGLEFPLGDPNATL